MVHRIHNVRAGLENRAMLLAFLLITFALLIAALLRAPLTWDGSYYFFLMLMDSTPMVAHDRQFDYVLHWPVIQALEMFGSVPTAMVVFNLIHVTTPLIALLLCWWVVRIDHPGLMYWAFVGVLLMMLPGQINFISEGIKAEQLFWPLLMCLIVGLPRRTVPLTAVLAVIIYWLHPAASPIFLAAALTAAALAIVRPVHRRTLAISVVPFVVLGLMRYGRIGGSQAESEMTWFTQERQFINSVHGPTTIALFCFIVMAALYIHRIWAKPRQIISSDLRMFLALGLGCGALLIWAAFPQQWWEALEYRGPAFWFTMFTAAVFVLGELIISIRKSARPTIPRLLYPAMAAGFALVITVQSVAWSNVLNNFEHQMRSGSQACLAREDIHGMHRTPLNLWSTTPTSLILQGDQPEYVSMTTEECQEAIITGKVVILDNPVRSEGDFISLSGIEMRLPEATACTWVETEGWYQQEANWLDRWQWSGGEGLIRIESAQDGAFKLQGDLISVETTITVEIVVNGEVQGLVEATPEGEPVDEMMVQLSKGENIVEFRSDASPLVPAGDDRALSFAWQNATVRPADGSAPCVRLEPIV